ncbi:calcium-binding protein [Streptomyces sp. 4N509B]|uniref:calcium-binding protein n=1 Tax=Streptomyces sp. 4N509B TaxID=3457413 RepID=UPI003FD5E9DE
MRTGTGRALRRSTVIVGAAALVAVGLAAPASAATLATAEVVDGTVRYTAGDNQNNEVYLHVSDDQDEVHIEDVIWSIIPGPGCARVDPDDRMSVVCDLAPVDGDHDYRTEIDLGDGDDLLSSAVAGRNLFRGGDGADIILATTEDRVIGGYGDDLLNGGTVQYGNAGDDDLYYGGTSYGGAGSDYLVASKELAYGGTGDDTLQGTEDGDQLDGGIGHDMVWSLSGDDEVYGQDGRDVIYGGKGHDTVYGGRHDDRLFGNSGDDLLYGNSGNDYLSGGPDSDHLSGGPGTDLEKQ